MIYWITIPIIYKIGEKGLVIIDIYGAREILLLSYDHQDTKYE